MDSNKEVKPLKKQFDFADVPSWYGSGSSSRAMAMNGRCLSTASARLMSIIT